jgi:hypothetical protein
MELYCLAPPFYGDPLEYESEQRLKNVIVFSEFPLLPCVARKQAKLCRFDTQQLRSDERSRHDNKPKKRVIACSSPVNFAVSSSPRLPPAYL